MVNIIEDVSPLTIQHNYDLILVGTNCYQVMSNGFQWEIKKAYPQAYKANLRTEYGNPNKLGDFIIEGKVIIGFISLYYNLRGNNDELIDYEALIKLLKLLNITYKGKKIVTSFIGTTHFDGNGDKAKVLEICNKYCTNFDLTICDYNQKTGNQYKQKLYINNIKKQKQINSHKK